MSAESEAVIEEINGVTMVNGFNLDMLACPPPQRRAGHTTAMIVQLLSKCEFAEGEDTYHIVGGNLTNADRLHKETIEIAERMGFIRNEDFRVLSHTTILFSGQTLVFVPMINEDRKQPQHQFRDII